MTDTDAIPPVLPTYDRLPTQFVRGDGVWLFTQDEEDYIDFGSGIAVNCLGHCHPDLAEVLSEQAEKLWHVSNLYDIPGQIALAKRLCELTFADTVFFTNSGAEAVECCIKICRKYWASQGQLERNRIITFSDAFHGRTIATITASGQKKMIDGFGPLVDGFDQVEFGDHEALKAAITERTAGILVEPVQGEGGIRVIPEQCLKGLRELCDERGILLIFDEVQCGAGRTGKLFAHEWAGITPDLMSVAKGIGGGFPVGACLATEKAARCMGIGTHGTTYGGNPLAVAVVAEVLRHLTADGFMQHVLDMEGLLRKKVEKLIADYPTVLKGVRGKGLMLGMECVVTNTDLMKMAAQERILTVTAGENVLRLLPPLNVQPDEIEEAMTRLARACQRVTE